MSNSLLIDLIINKIKIFDDLTIANLGNKFPSLTPAGKYQAFLLTSSIVINRLKAIDSFKINNVDVDFFMIQLLQECIVKFEEYKAEHNLVYNTFKHSSAVIENRLNLENRNFFGISHEKLRLDSYAAIGFYSLQFDYKNNFDEIYVNLFVHPNFYSSVDKSEQPSTMQMYLKMLYNHDIPTSNFTHKIAELINQFATKLNEDSYFITKASKADSSSKNCYVATLVYNDIEHPNVDLLRRYRDEVLSAYFFGRIFIKYYYLCSPHLVEFLRPYILPQNVIRKILDRFVRGL